MSGLRSQAVFLSYASQDAAVARRIAEALRAAGVEVWFDQNELVGGDAWDAKIRRQIAECALFVPVISANTQARLEGYFRIEWKLAAQRTHAMAEEKAFLLPVVIDDTRDGEARVPGEFKAVQWTRGPGGEVGVNFVRRVQALLAGSAGVLSATATNAGGTPVLPGAGGRRSRRALGLVAVALVLGAGAWWWASRQPAPAASPVKTLAVLPFVTSNGGRDDENISDGIADELLTQLGRAPGLRVSGRMSSFSFKGQKLTDAEIARKLDVAYLVAGTFERSGAHVRIRPQLINAADGSILWGETFTKELTNVFALQDEVAGLIARQLQVKLGSAARAKRTVDPVAYGLAQKGRYLWLKRSDDALAGSAAAYEEAIKLDPSYAEAHAGLADATLVRGWYMGIEGANQGARFHVQARAAAQRALQLDATLAEPHAALGAINLNEERFAEAEQEFQAALRLNPNYSYGHHWRAHLLSAHGRLDEAVAAMARATQIDPFSLSTLVIHAATLAHAGRHAEAVVMCDRALAVRQGEFPPVDGLRAASLWAIGRRDDAVAAARAVAQNVLSKPRWWVDGAAIHVLRKAGHEAEAQAHAARLLAAWPDNGYFRLYVAVAFGRVDEALDLLATTPVTPTVRAVIYYSDLWAEVRQSPRFPGVLQKLGWAQNYEQGRATLAKMQREPVRK